MPLDRAISPSRFPGTARGMPAGRPRWSGKWPPAAVGLADRLRPLSTVLGVALAYRGRAEEPAHGAVAAAAGVYAAAAELISTARTFMAVHEKGKVRWACPTRRASCAPSPRAPSTPTPPSAPGAGRRGWGDVDRHRRRRATGRDHARDVPVRDGPVA